MSLLDDYSRPCILMERTRDPDGAGGFYTTWTEGILFYNHQALNTSMEARLAEKQGVTSVYTALVDKNVPIEYGDYYKDMGSGETFRVTSIPDEKQAPASSTIPMKVFTAERKALPA